MKKYKLGETVVIGEMTLHRVIAVVDFGHIKAGTVGGYVENEHNLAHDGNCWVYDNARITGNASIQDNAIVSEHACVQDASIKGDAQIKGNAVVTDRVMVCDKAIICGDTKVGGDAQFCGDAQINSQNDFMFISIFGKDITFFKCADGTVKVFYPGDIPKISTFNGEKRKKLFTFREFYDETTDLFKEGGVFFSLCVAVKRYFNI